MKRTLLLLLAAVAIVACAASLGTRGGARADSMEPETQDSGPATGFKLHIDALRHFPNHPNEVAHHWCKSLTGMTECQIYDSDGPKARLVGAEMVVPTAVWKTFPADEQKLWHYHRVEIPKVSATLPSLSKEEAAKVVASLQETYGKVYQLWDPMTTKLPMGQPQVNVLK